MIYLLSTYPIQYPGRNDGTVMISVVLGFAFLLMWITISINQSSSFNIYQDRLEIFDSKVLLWWERRRTVIPIDSIVGYDDSDSFFMIYYNNIKTGMYEGHSYTKHSNDSSSQKNVRLLEIFLKENGISVLKDDKILSIVISSENYKFRTYLKRFIWKTALFSSIVIVTDLILFQFMKFEYGILAANYAVVITSFFLPIILFYVNERLISLNWSRHPNNNRINRYQ